MDGIQWDMAGFVALTWDTKTNLILVYHIHTSILLFRRGHLKNRVSLFLLFYCVWSGYMCFMSAIYHMLEIFKKLLIYGIIRHIITLYS